MQSLTNEQIVYTFSNYKVCTKCKKSITQKKNKGPLKFCWDCYEELQKLVKLLKVRENYKQDMM